MKSLISIMVLLVSISCFAQAKKDTTSKAVIKQKEVVNQKPENQKTIPLNTEMTIGNKHIYKIMSEAQYYQEFKKPLLKDVFEQNLKTDQEVISGNMQGILADVRRANEDKRSLFLKAFQGTLGIAQAAVVTALAVREVVRAVENKPKK